MTLYLHFGMQKTASTSLQRSLARKGRWDGAEYLHSGRSNCNDLVELQESDPTAYAAKLKTLVARIRAADPARIHSQIVSSENLPLLSRDGFDELLARFAAAGRPVRIVGYIRKPKSFMESMFQQRLKRKRMTPADIALLYPGYRGKFAKFEAAAERGAAETAYWPFEVGHMHAGCVVQDFCRRLGVSFAAADVVKDNIALSRPAISLLYAYRLFGPGYGHGARAVAENRWLVAELGRIPGPKLRFHSSLVAPILDENRADVAWMEKRLGASLAERLDAEDASAIRTLDDLLDFDSAALDWLAAAADTPVGLAPGTARPSAKRIARWVHMLRGRLAAGRHGRAAGLVEAH